MGTLLLAGAALILIGAAILSFFKSAARSSRILFAAGAALQFISFALLVRAFILNDFSLLYVRDNSSLATPLLYKISAAWAGQQGSFLLWSMFTSVAALPLVFVKEKWVYPVAACAAASFALVSFAAANPFIHAASPAADGAGLRAILQSPWMAVHPPVLFLGYALTVIPFARAVDAVLRRDLSALILSRASAFLIAAVAGAGIVLGGTWAYETLGWGGFWGWDPVENSSLVPWLAAVALIHVLTLQKRGGNWEKAAFGLSVSLFILTLFSSFLTRSGILASVSVHSFGSSALALPLGYMTSLALLVPFGALIARGKQLFPPSKKQEEFREIVAGTGVTTQIFYAFMILVVTIAPLALLALGRSPVTVKSSFFNNISLFFALLFLCAIAITVPFKAARADKKITAAIAVSSAALSISFFLRLHPFAPLLHGVVALAGVIAALYAISLFQGNIPRRLPHLLGHVGFALFAAGCVSTAFLSVSERKDIPAGDTVSLLKTELTFKGIRDDGGKGLFLLEMSSGGKRTDVSIPFEKLSDGSLMSVRPSIRHGVLEDIYLYAEGFLSKAEVEKIVNMEKIDAKKADTVLINISRKKMMFPILSGALLMIAGFFAGFLRARKEI